MSALIILIAICLLGLGACGIAWVLERETDAEAESYGNPDWADLAPGSDTPIHTVIDPHADITYQAMCFERWEREQ